MTSTEKLRLGVNIDHVATLRNARGTVWPDPLRAAMTREEVERFVQLFERVSRHALRTLPAIADRTLRLDKERHVKP